MNEAQHYPIGTPGKKWGDPERAAWRDRQAIQRSYQEDVVGELEPLRESLDVEQYGALSYDSDRYPLFAIKTRAWNSSKPTVLVTGGVHGYETSGVHGALRFLQTQVQAYSDRFNIVVAPCLSPWGYETINRWNPKAVDPNRSFYSDSPAEECAALMQYIDSLSTDIFVHIDLHETTDTDNSEFRPALCARDAIEQDEWEIPDGFYLVGDTDNPLPDFQKAIIDAVEIVTHIAPADKQGRIIGELITQHGVINYATKGLGLCSGFTNCTYATTTEVYPDSPKVDDENCILAQVAAVTGGLNYVTKMID